MVQTNEELEAKNKYWEHDRKWERARKLVKKYNEELIKEWNSIPWWKFWIKKPSHDERVSIILDNWSKFNCLPRPRLYE